MTTKSVLLKRLVSALIEPTQYVAHGHHLRHPFGQSLVESRGRIKCHPRYSVHKKFFAEEDKSFISGLPVTDGRKLELGCLSNVFLRGWLFIANGASSGHVIQRFYARGGISIIIY